MEPITIGDFFKLCNLHPWAYIAILINLGVVFVNGYTDGPSTIATSVATRAIKPRTAFLLCAVFNLLGALLIGAFSVIISKVFGGDIVSTMSSLVNFGEANTDQVLCAIACGLVAIIGTSQICTMLGLPSSQSNCLIGGLTGAGIALIALGYKGSIGLAPWIKVIIGFIGSLIIGFILGYLITLFIQFIFKRVTLGKANRFFDKGQIISCSLMNLVHGIQDGGKFIGIFVLIVAILMKDSSGIDTASAVSIMNGTWWIYLPVCLVLFVSCLVGNTKILKNIGRGMAQLKRYQAFSTDIAASIGLIIATLFGVPLSTGTIKNTAIIGSGATKSIRRIKWKKAGSIILWGALVFPFAAIMGFIVTMIFVWTC